MYKSKLSSCLNHKHLDNKILVSKKIISGECVDYVA